MDETVIVILLLTGVCIASGSPKYFYFSNSSKTWSEAQDYCVSEHIQMAQLFNKKNLNALMNTPTGGYTDKAWIGLYEGASLWAWLDGELATYFNWNTYQPDDTNTTEVCVTMTDDGFWNNVSCSQVKPSVCFDGVGYDIVDIRMTLFDAKNNCENQSSILATIPDEITNSNIQKLLANVTEVWIGLGIARIWYWSGAESRENKTLMNWRSGQPDNLNGLESCAAVVLEDGTWTDEQCDAAYPFFCISVHKSRKTVVRMKIQSTANMEDQAVSAELQKQLHAAFASKHLTDFKLTWNKLPVKK
ncbi:C-type mannose receptor 2-like [Trachinotus anak]|uniref:C-type mannose receptor 2-like n=1 Tax=Trachinotus anak TaxID=443729 RepID=UPI0039F1ACE7